MSLCATGFSVTVGEAAAAKTYCMKNKVSASGSRSAVDLRADCLFTTFTFKSADEDTETTGTTKALCGFNKGNKAYCP